MRTSKVLFFKRPNFSKTACDYAKYRKGFPKEFFYRLQDRGLIKPGKIIVDLGTGTGTIARKLAMLNCKVIGIDPTSELLDEARKQDQIVGAKVNYLSASAENTTLSSHLCDVVIVGQAWHWFDQIAAITEIKRILKPSGVLIIAHYEWITQKDSVPELTENLMKKYNYQWNKVSQKTGIFDQWATQLGDHHFTTKIEKLDVMEQYTHDQWLGRVRASPPISGVLTSEELKKFDSEHAEELARKYSQSILSIPHQCCILEACLPGLTLHKTNKEEKLLRLKP